MGDMVQHTHFYNPQYNTNCVWCGQCQCFIIKDCDHENCKICIERKEYIRLRAKYVNKFTEYDVVESKSNVSTSVIDFRGQND